MSKKEFTEEDYKESICKLLLDRYPKQLKWMFKVLANRKGIGMQDLMIEVHANYMEGKFTTEHWAILWKEIQKYEVEP